MTNVSFAGLLWMVVGVHLCARYYSEDPYVLIAAGSVFSQVAMGLADAIDALGLSPTDIITIGACVTLAYDLRVYIVAIARDVHIIKKLK